MKSVIKNPRITEKASNILAGNVYTFEIAAGASKTEVSKAIFEIYKVKPTKVNVLTLTRKKVFARGKTGAKGGGKIARVYLKKGDKIEFI